VPTRSVTAPPHADGPPATRPARSRDPLWARVALIFGALLILTSGSLLIGGVVLNARYGGAVDQQDLLPQDERRSQLDANRPLNLLLVGIDARPDNNTDPVRGDSIIIVHIPKGHDRAYLMSLPRDLIVDIPASPPQRPRASREKLNGAFPYGADGGRGIPGGFQLLSRTVSNLTGVDFDGAAVINFEGFRAVVRELGGVTMCLDQQIVSEHMGNGPDGKYLHPREGGKPWVYPAGCHKLDDWQALDVVRQRKSLPDGDYGRQRNQQKFLKAMLQQAKSRGVVTDPRKLDAVIRAAGKALTFDGNGVSPAEWAFALRGISEGSLVLVRTPGHGVGEGDAYQGEELDPAGVELIRALRDKRLDEFVVAHPELVNRA
jgi:polyisoprenyl-teichoic acid--peptidoglycan teichoic acid transferase